MQEFDLAKNERIIREGWYAGLIISLISILMLIISLLWNNPALSGNENHVYYTVVDIVGILALSNGLLQKSRFCAVLIPFYFLAVNNQPFLSLNFPFNAAGLLGILLFTAVFIRSAAAVFKFHKLSSHKNFTIMNNNPVE